MRAFPLSTDTPDDSIVANPRLSGLFAFNRQRKQSSRDNLLIAATKLFCRDGYANVGIEDITSEAGVSRITFYRHFSAKSAVALELFQHAAVEGAPRVLAIADRDYRDRDTVVEWLAEFFAADREMQGILRVLAQANVQEADFSKQVHPFIDDLIADLGQKIPAFADCSGPDCDQHRRIKAWLLLYTILDQSNAAATDSSVVESAVLVDVLADSFLDFVRKE